MKANKKAERLSISYNQVFNTPEGRKVLHDLLAFCNFFKSTYSKGDPYTTAYNNGLRDAALRIVALINIVPDELNKLTKEARTISKEYEYDGHDSYTDNTEYPTD